MKNEITNITLSLSSKISDLKLCKKFAQNKIFKKNGFTLAEILLSLSIIGIVAAIALPSLLGNVNERAFETQKKALYTRFSQALPLLPSLNGYGTLEGTLSQGKSGQEGYVPQSVTVDTAAETFVRDGLSKVMKITNICDNEHLTDCGLPDKIIPINNGDAINLSDINKLSELSDAFNGKIETTTNAYEQLDTKAAAFETVNGESILTYYNPNCEPDLKKNYWHWAQPKMCANFIYDLNGKKGPNTVGKDIGFITALYSTDPVIVAPNPYPVDFSQGIAKDMAYEKCKETDKDARVPNIDELVSLVSNIKLMGTMSGSYWSSTIDSTKAWTLGSRGGLQLLDSINLKLRCVKR